MAKNFFREIAFLAVLKIFPSSKIDFLAIFEIAKSGCWLRKIREIDLFDFPSFFGLDFLKFSGPLCVSMKIKMKKQLFVYVYIFLCNQLRPVLLNLNSRL